MKENYKSQEAQPTQSARTKNSYSPICNGIALAVVVKTPGLSPIKTRLAKHIGDKEALDFYGQSVEATARVLENVRRQFHYVHLYWAVAEADGLKNSYWSRKGWNTIGQGEGALGERLGRVWRELRCRHDAVIFMGADSPHVSDDVVESAVEFLTMNGPNEREKAFRAVLTRKAAPPRENLDKASRPESLSKAVIGPTEDGGFYLFGSLEADFPWEEVTYSSDKTLDELISAFQLAGNVYELPIMFDIDEASDLERLNCEVPFWTDACSIIQG